MCSMIGLRGFIILSTTSPLEIGDPDWIRTSETKDLQSWALDLSTTWPYLKLVGRTGFEPVTPEL